MKTITSQSPIDTVVEVGDLIENKCFPSCYHEVEEIIISEESMIDTHDTKNIQKWDKYLVMGHGRYGDEIFRGGIYPMNNNESFIQTYYKQ
jgi:hypothetical protein